MQLIVKHDLRDEARETLRKRTELLRQVKATLRSVSFALERRIKLEMPVDTGRARASWGHWGGLVRQNKDASPADAVWEMSEDGLSVKQGSNVEYIDRLNAGHSQQAPDGFLDVAERWGMEELDKALDNIMRQW